MRRETWLRRSTIHACASSRPARPARSQRGGRERGPPGGFGPPGPAGLVGASWERAARLGETREVGVVAQGDRLGAGFLEDLGGRSDRGAEAGGVVCNCGLIDAESQPFAAL